MRKCLTAKQILFKAIESFGNMWSDKLVDEMVEGQFALQRMRWYKRKYRWRQAERAYMRRWRKWLDTEKSKRHSMA